MPHCNRVMKKVVIVDYQLGNLFSVEQACSYLGHDTLISSNPDDLSGADCAIIPGVGAFADAMQNLRNTGMDEAILEFVKAGKPLMGICLGLQLFLTSSEEFGNSAGLNLIPGTVKRFAVETDQNGLLLKVPQIQWNTIRQPAPGRWEKTPLAACKDNDQMYFVHSFYAVPDNEKDVAALTAYGNHEYCSAVSRDNVFATQFHPEKSGLYGLRIYEQWFKNI